MGEGELWGIKAALGPRTAKSGDVTSCRCTGGCCNFWDACVFATKAIVLFICISTHSPSGPVGDCPFFSFFLISGQFLFCFLSTQ